jgi:hypothetical protein
MYDMNTILAAMAEGKTADDLAKEFTDALNAANAKIEADRIAAEKAAKANTAKVAAFKDIMIDIVDFVNTFYADQLPSEVVTALNNEIKDETVADVVKEIDALIKMSPMLLALIDRDAAPKAASPAGWFSFSPQIKFVDKTKDEGKSKRKTIKTISQDEANKIIHDFLGQIL